MSEAHDRAALARRGLRPAGQTPAYLVQDGDALAAALVGRGSRAGRGVRERAARAGRAARATPSRSSARARVEWALFDFALGSIGAIAAPIYANSSAKDTAYILDHSESVGVLCEDDVQRAKVESVRGELPRLQHVLTFADLDDLAARGRAYAAEHPSALREAGEAIDEDDLFTYIYTSGTTGPPKGCMISHRNYYAMVAVVDDLPTSRSRGHDAPLPPARAQLRPADAPLGRVRRLHDRVPARPAAGRGCAAGGEADASSRACPRVYEKVHAAVVAKFDAADRRKAAS